MKQVMIFSSDSVLYQWDGITSFVTSAHHSTRRCQLRPLLAWYPLFVENDNENEGMRLPMKLYENCESQTM